MKRTIGEIQDSYNSYSMEELQELLNTQKCNYKESVDSLEAAKEYERVNHIIEKRFAERYGDAPHKYGGRYGDLYKHPDYYTTWKGTFFDKQRLFIEEHLVRRVKPLSRIPSLLNGECDIPELNGLNLPIKAYIMGYCDRSVGTKNGPTLHLVEPYGEYTTPPFLGAPDSMSELYEGKICVVLLQFQKGVVPQILAITTLPFTLTDKIKPGTKEADTLTEPPAPLTETVNVNNLFDYLDNI